MVLENSRDRSLGLRILRGFLRITFAVGVLYCGVYLALRAFGHLRYHKEFDTLYFGRDVETPVGPGFQIWDHDFPWFYPIARLDPTNSFKEHEIGTTLEIGKRRRGNWIAMTTDGIQLPDKFSDHCGSWLNEYGNGVIWAAYRCEEIESYCQRVLQNPGRLELRHHQFGEWITPLQKTGPSTVSLLLARDDDTEVRAYFLHWDPAIGRPRSDSSVILVCARS